MLYQLVRDHLESLLAEGRDASEYGVGYPKYVEQEFRGYLECGLLQRGFARLACSDCGHERLLAFSCKGRSVCPSCVGRRMADTAAHLVDHVMPHVPYRQWTLSLPVPIRWKAVRDPQLLSKLLTAALRTLFNWQRRQARRSGMIRPEPGAVSFVQRFGSLLQVNVHFHCWLPDGVFVRTPLGELAFEPIDPPTSDELATLLGKIRSRVLALCEEDVPEPDDDDIAVASAQQLAITSPIRCLPHDQEPRNNEASVFDRGFSLHAGLAVEADDRRKLERLLRYGLRPPYAQKRLSMLPDGRVKLKLRKPYYTGQTSVVFEPLDFLRRLAAIIPPPRQNLVRYHGIFASNAKGRRAVARLAESTRGTPSATPRPPTDLQGEPATPAPDDESSPRYRRLWADLLRRTFAIDATRCPRCDGQLRLLAVIKDPAVIDKILGHLGLPTEIPAPAAARPPPQLGLCDDWSPG